MSLKKGVVPVDWIKDIKHKLEEQNRRTSSFLPHLEQKSRQFINADGSIKDIEQYTCEDTKKQQEQFALNAIRIMKNACHVLKPDALAVESERLDFESFKQQYDETVGMLNKVLSDCETVKDSIEKIAQDHEKNQNLSDKLHKSN